MVEISNDMCFICIKIAWTESACFWWWFVTVNIMLGIILRFLQHDVLEIGPVVSVRCEEGYIPIQFGMWGGGSKEF
jgi:hypothetical protein